MTTTGTTVITVEIEGGKAAIADIREALDLLEREGIPDTFNVDIRQWTDRDDSDTSIDYGARPRIQRMTFAASRAAR